jgi:hypothetical protein
MGFERPLPVSHTRFPLREYYSRLTDFSPLLSLNL